MDGTHTHVWDASKLGIRPSSISSTDSENTAIRKDVRRLYHSVEVSSAYGTRSVLSFPTLRSEPSTAASMEPTSESTVDVNSNISGLVTDATHREQECDIEDPSDWPQWKKVLNVCIILLLSFLSAFASTVASPSVPSIMRSFSSLDGYISAFVISIYILGHAAGSLVLPTLSQTYGRVPFYHICNLILVAMTCWCARTTSRGEIATARLLAGCGGSAVFVLSPGSVADIFSKEKRVYAQALMTLSCSLGAVAAPPFGNYIENKIGWRWVFWATAMVGAFVTLAAFCSLSETCKPVLQQRNGKRSRGEQVEEKSRSKLDIDFPKPLCQSLRHDVAHIARMLLLPDLFLASLLSTVSQLCVYVLYITLPETFTHVYEFPRYKIGLAYVGSLVGILIGMVVVYGINMKTARAKDTKGDTQPTDRLMPLLYLWPLISLGLWLYAWTARYRVHWAVAMIGTAVCAVGCTSSIFCTYSYVLDAYPSHGIEASLLLQSLVVGTIPMFSYKLYDTLKVGWAFTILAFIAIALAPVPFIVYKFGKKMRRHVDGDAGNDI